MSLPSSQSSSIPSPSIQSPSAQSPSAQSPSAQSPSAQAPSSQASSSLAESSEFPCFAFGASHEFLKGDLLESLRAMKLKRLERGEEVADLSMLNPDMAPPRFLLDKLMEACAKPYNHRYAVSRGVRRLREAFAEKYQARFGVSLHAESEVCATMGTKDAVLQALRVLCAPKTEFFVCLRCIQLTARLLRCMA
jgi:DNA-binding transcriptional MocR family regulator